MSEVVYRYQMTGKAAGSQSWECSGEVVGNPGSFPDLLWEAMRSAFAALSEGRAELRVPGMPCAAPYIITGFALELAPPSRLQQGIEAVKRQAQSSWILPTPPKRKRKCQK